MKKALLNATELDTMIIMKTIAAHRVWINAAATRAIPPDSMRARPENPLNFCRYSTACCISRTFASATRGSAGRATSTEIGTAASLFQ